MKVLFLDVDGVLNCWTTKELTLHGYKFVERKFVKRVKRIVDETGCKIVLSSTWRKGYYDLLKDKVSDEDATDADDYVLLHNMFQFYGIEIYSHTPMLNESHRGLEIEEWLKNTTDEVERFVILDDDIRVYPYTENLVATFLDSGLTEELTDKVIKMLNE